MDYAETFTLKTFSLYRKIKKKFKNFLLIEKISKTSFCRKNFHFIGNVSKIFIL